MKISRRLAFALLPLMPIVAHAGDNEDSALSQDPSTGAFRFSWSGAAGRTYFILYSEDLVAWTYLPIIEQGSGTPLAYGLSVSAGTTKFFLRLRYTDQPAADPYAADFDGDGIPNGWEIEHGLIPFDASDASTVVGGLTNLARYQQSLINDDPTIGNSVGLVVYTP